LSARVSPVSKADDVRGMIAMTPSTVGSVTGSLLASLICVCLACSPV
jgi:hypothetical protein